MSIGYQPFGTAFGAPRTVVGGPSVASYSTAALPTTRVLGSTAPSVYGGYPGIAQPGVIGSTYGARPVGYGAPAYGAPAYGAPAYGAPAYGGYGGQVIRPAYTTGRVVQGGRYTLGQYAQRAYENKHVTDAKLNNLKEVRAASGLQYIPVGVGLSTIKKAAINERLEKDTFTNAYVALLEGFQIDAPSQDVCTAVFDLFDRDGNGIVDMMELVCGMSLLCQGTEQEKIEAVFRAFDEDGDQFVSMEEMNKFLLSVFRVVLTPAVIGIMRAQGVEVESPEDLAWVTTQECFKDADKNHDKKLSLDEFSKWFNEPSTDPSLVFSPIKNIFH